MPVCSEPLFECVFAENVTAFDNVELSESEAALPDDKICAELEAIVNDGYDRTLSETPAKLSVTEITKKLKKEETSFRLQAEASEVYFGQPKAYGFGTWYGYPHLFPVL